jgi:hypothetical protein
MNSPKIFFSFFFVCGLLLLSQCVSRSRCERRFGPCGYEQNSTFLPPKDTHFVTPNRVLVDSIVLSTPQNPATLPTFEWQSSDSTGKLRLQAQSSGTGVLQLRCTAQADTVRITLPREIIRQTIPVIPIWVKWVLGVSAVLGTFTLVQGVVIALRGLNR